MIKEFMPLIESPQGLVSSHGLLALALFVFVVRIVKIIYRIWLHPLAKFPGPKLAAATTGYEFYYNVVKDGMFHWKLIDLHEQFGHVVRIAPNELHFSDPDFHHEIYTGQKNPRDKYAPFYRFTGAVQSTFETHHRQLHKSRRLLLMNAFSKRSIVAIEPLILSKVNLLAERFERAHHDGTLIRLDSAFSALTADITSEYGYGKSLGYLADDDFKNDIRESLLASLTLFHIVRFFPLVMHGAKVLPFKVVQFLNPMLSKVLSLRSLINSMNVEEMAKMREGKPSRAMLVKTLNDPSIPKSERSLERLNDEGFVFMNAGTTAGKTLAFIMFHLLKDDCELLRALHKELKAAYPENMDDITWRDLEALPYLRGVVYEGLRLSLGPVTRLPRVAPADPISYRGQVIPPGTAISMSNHFLHMNPLFFPNPSEYRPERWVEAQERGERPENYLATFGKGTRHCMGKSLAYAEMFMTIAVLARHFGMTLHETEAKDVAIVRDRIFGYPDKPSKGVQVYITELKK